jgi:hypothetical protein
MEKLGILFDFLLAIIPLVLLVLAFAMCFSLAMLTKICIYVIFGWMFFSFIFMLVTAFIDIKNNSGDGLGW